ncbi:MAG: ABC transporter ATP-binding protein [Actinomycetes bacterium]|jgi:ABC-2 type transport system ATP-binding protein|nr:MAG: ABC transporter [Actinomycetota bacterium]
MNGDTVIEVDGLTHDYGEVVALRDLNLTVPPGITGLVGANGAGKTTLLRILLGLIHPTQGAVKVLGRSPEEEPLEVRARVGYMPEVGSMPLDQTAADFVAYTAELAGLPPQEAKRRSSETLFLVGLEEERFRYLGDFSTGMKQRVKLAQAIVHDPELVLLDEPASGLDPEGREQMLELIRRLGQFGINVVVSSHVLSDIEKTCDWVVMLDAGNFLRSAPLKGFERDTRVLVEVLERPEELAARLAERGIEATVDGMRVLVGPGEGLEDAIIGTAARLGTGVVRMTRGSTSLEDLFLDHGRAS